MEYDQRFTLYTQLSSRNVDENNNAFLLGVKMEKQTFSKFEIDAKIEFRNYGAGFNRGFINNVYYRDPEGSSNFTNSTFGVFAPLITYERDFSQWAVFAEYQERNVSGFMLQSSIAYNLFSKTYLRAAFDFNWISPKGEDSFVYPFYSMGFGGKPLEDIEISSTLSLTGCFPFNIFFTFFLVF